MKPKTYSIETEGYKEKEEEIKHNILNIINSVYAKAKSGKK